MNEQQLNEIEEILRKVEKTKDQLEKDRQCYTCALGHCDECGTYCEKAADDYDCEEEGCSNFKDGTPSSAQKTPREAWERPPQNCDHLAIDPFSDG